ncbi:hypothetical protein OHA02_52395 [Streptomyces phaeochromogenes]|nr:hypothetical protein [Streptomyces phaeochromogenes]
MFGRLRKTPNPPPPPVPREGAQEKAIAEHLDVPLRRWIREVVDNEDNAEKIALSLQMTVNTGPHRYSPLDYLVAHTTREEIPAVIEAILRMSAPPPAPAESKSVPPDIRRLNLVALAQTHSYTGINIDWRSRAIDALEGILTLGGSPYRINAERTGLEARVDATAHQALASTLTTASDPNYGSASEHLATAWTCIYGRNPDPGKAYAEAIKAVECAAQATVEPKSKRATLGSMLKVLGNSTQKFSTEIPATSGDDIMVVIEMMRRLWQGQSSRHGAQTPTKHETQGQAEMAVHLAVTLVQWFSAGFVKRNP